MASTKQRGFKVGDLVWWETGFGRVLVLVLEITDDSLNPKNVVYDFETQVAWYAPVRYLKHAYRQSK